MSQNLIQNPEFSSGSMYWSPSKWYPENQVEFATTGGMDGCCVKLKVRSAGDPGQSSIAQSVMLNEKLAALMRRLRMCEELGTGWDKIVITCELALLPAPKIELFEESTRVTLYTEMPFSNISREDKLWACYLHACIKQVQNEQLTNASLRMRFGLKESSSGSISRLIKDAVDEKLIKPLDPTTAPRYMRYIPIWA